MTLSRGSPWQIERGEVATAIRGNTVRVLNVGSVWHHSDGHVMWPGEVQVSSIVAEHSRVVSAFDEPTLSLLRGSLAPANVAVLRTAFSQDQKTQAAARLHQVVDSLLRELRERGLPHVPDGDGRDVCMLWVRRRWLTRDVDGTTYTLTSHAMQALGLVRDLTRDRLRERCQKYSAPVK